MNGISKAFPGFQCCLYYFCSETSKLTNVKALLCILKNSIHGLMIMDVRLPAKLNLIVQLVLAVALFLASRLALARDFKNNIVIS